jgi:predicted nucleic acid-binding protein
MILLDTNIVIAFFNGNKSVLREMREQIDSIALSVLVIAELDYGAKASQRARRTEQAISVSFAGSSERSERA